MPRFMERLFHYTATGATVVLLPTVSPGQAHASRRAAADSVSIVGVAAEFHEALHDGDSTKAKSLLAPDLFVLESGEIETRADYLKHHLPADIEAAQSITSTRKILSVTIEKDVAWVVSSSVSTGSFHGRAINSTGAELMILSRSGNRWRIRAVHWSSARRPAPVAGE